MHKTDPVQHGKYIC